MKQFIFSLTLLLGLHSPLQAMPTNKDLNIGMTQEFENFNPLIMSMMATVLMYRMVGRTLVVLDENSQWITQLAEDIPTLENGQAKRFKENGVDKISAQWRIKEAAKWGDGTPLTCHDFEFSWKVAQSDFVSIGEKEVYAQVERMEIDPKNPKHCIFYYKEAKWTFNRIATFYALPKHLEEDVFKQYGQQAEGYEQHSNYTKNPTNPGLFSGPYRIAQIQLGSHVTFERNPHFYGEQAKIERITFKLIPNSGALEANLRSGTIDMVSSLGMSFDQALAFNEKVQKEKFPYIVNFKSSLVYEHLDINLDHPALKDLTIRKALVYSIDRKGLTDALFEGKQPPAIHNLSPLDPWYTKDPERIVSYRHSRRFANRLLDEAGWTRAKDGIREKEGVRLSFSLMTTAGNRVRELVQVYLQDQWKSIGIDVQIKNEPARVFFGETTRKRAYEGLALYAWVSSPESNPRSTLASSNIPNEANGWSGQNYPGWKNDRVDEIVVKLLDQEFDAIKRLDLIHEVLWHYTNEVPVIPLYYRSDVSIVPINLTGYQLPGHQFPETNHVERWSLSTSEAL